MSKKWEGSDRKRLLLQVAGAKHHMENMLERAKYMADILRLVKDATPEVQIDEQVRPYIAELVTATRLYNEAIRDLRDGLKRQGMLPKPGQVFAFRTIKPDGTNKPGGYVWVKVMNVGFDTATVLRLGAEPMIVVSPCPLTIFAEEDNMLLSEEEASKPAPNPLESNPSDQLQVLLGGLDEVLRTRQHDA